MTPVRGFEIVSGFRDLASGIHLPERKTQFSAGYDIFSVEDVCLEPAKVTLIATGLKAYMPGDEFLGIYIRSGMAVKHQLCLVNSVGIIDADYYNNPDNEGHILVAVLNLGPEKFILPKGTRFAQGIFQKYFCCDYENDANGDAPHAKRMGGIGSTGTIG
ncbi:deoxyuridine 5'-triphosphate nucleotidohydrolase [Acetonema longum]|uniref:dUTP diphosphatase n=1 Tax=Acetonema longum DSM 6540 TaxID=1009370 RepID=F7NLA8_9FIRM|nr:deoxyuridine 5'-triphosphate nucleotidohydrolase [Acetonema longum]EGO63213.1 deoxyUTP pyrophosphatase [Acetonema longum DSM 6540]